MMNNKNKIVLFAEAPVNLVSGNSVTAHNYRSQQFIELLLRQQIPVIVVVINRNIRFPSLERRMGELFEFWEINDKRIGWLSSLRKRLRKEKLSAAIGFMLNGALLARNVVTNLPLWIDFYGDPLIEKVGQDLCHLNQFGTLAIRWRLSQVLKWADRFSVCSESQKCLLIGALLYSGRIDFGNMKIPIVNIINYLSEPGLAKDKIIYQNKRLKNTPVTILYNGSVNSWTDVSFLSSVLEEVLLLRPDVQFVQFGKNVINQEHLNAFKNFTKKEDLNSRAQFLGEISETQAEEIYQNSHICINADVDTLETRFGWRTRYIKAITEGLVVVSTFGNDLADLLAKDGIGLFSPMGDKDAFVKNLLMLIDDVSLWNNLSEMGARYVSEKSQTDSQFKVLLQWLENPQKLISSNNFLTLIRNIGTYLRWSLKGRLNP